MTDREAGLIDYLFVLVKWRKSIILTFLIVCILAAGISLILPKVHRSYSTIFPPVEDSGMGISSLLSQVPLGGLGIGLGTVSQETYTVLAILKSRTVMESVAEEFNLMARYNTKNMEKTIKELRDNVRVDVNDDGTITVSTDASTKWLPSKEAENEARVLARNMANYFVSELDRLNKEVKIERAHNTRLFIERRYHQNQRDLEIAEDQLKKFQETYGTIALPEQTAATISAAAEIQARIIEKEIEINILRGQVGDSHSEVMRLSRELDELDNKYNDFIEGSLERFEGEAKEGLDLFIPLGTIPDIGLNYARLYREVIFQEKIMEFILPQYEQAKIQEAKDTPTIQILDEAVIPVKRIKPKRSFFVLFWGALSLLVSICIIFTIETIDHLRTESPEKYEKAVSIHNTLRHDILYPFRKNRT